MQPVTSQEWGQAYPNLPVGPGDRIFTDSDGRAEIQVGQTYLRIGPNSDVTLVEDSASSTSISESRKDQSVCIPTACGRGSSWTSARRTEMPSFKSPAICGSMYTRRTAQQYSPIYGEFADITAAGDFRQQLDNGQSLQLSGSNPVYPQWLQPAGPDDLDSWSQQRDQQLSQVASYQYVSPEVPGAADLDAHGDWQPETEYGPVWFPRDVPADWHPYHYGHWVNHEPWGWVWVEDESWGYAPFHYGRWVSYRGRWGWVPGPRTVRPVWSPALVVFAGGVNFGGGGVSVWFPLGPGEAYRPWYRCSPHYIDRVNISNIRESPSVRVQKTYVNVVNVTNITYMNQSMALRRCGMKTLLPVATGGIRRARRSSPDGTSATVAATGASSDAAFDCFASGCSSGSGLFRAPKIDQPAGPADCCQAGSHASCGAGKANSSAQADSWADGHCLAGAPWKSGRKADAASTRTAGSEPGQPANANQGGQPRPGQQVPGQPAAGRPVPPNAGQQERNPGQPAAVNPGGQPRPTPQQPVQPAGRPNQPNRPELNPNQPAATLPNGQPRPTPQQPERQDQRQAPPNANQQDRNPDQPPATFPNGKPRPTPQQPERQDQRPAPPNANQQERNPNQPPATLPNDNRGRRRSSLKGRIKDSHRQMLTSKSGIQISPATLPNVSRAQQPEAGQRPPPMQPAGGIQTSSANADSRR